MTRNSRRSEAGFSLVEVAVALGVISVGLIGTLSMVGVNRALMENNWDLARMNLIADGVMSEIAMQFHRDARLTTTPDYDWQADESGFGINILFTDNGYRPAASTLVVASGTAPISYHVTLTLVSPGGRNMTRRRVFYRALTP